MRTAARLNWHIAIRRYLVAMTLGNLVWETAQLPLYTLWGTGTPSAIAAAVLHCLLRDVAIASVALTLALAFVGASGWPGEKFREVAVTVIVLGVAYTIYSEYVNTVRRAAWAYSAWMPTLPVLGTGLAPMAQWLVVPWLSLLYAKRKRS